MTDSEDFIEFPRFPESISYGATGGPGFNTNVVQIQSGFKVSNPNWDIPLYTFDVAHSLKTQDDMNELIDFFYTAMGKAYGFRYKDWSDFYCDPTRGATNESNGPIGTATSFSLYKMYFSGSNPIRFRPIVKPVDSTLYPIGAVSPLQIFKSGQPFSDYTIDYTTGIVTLKTGTGAGGANSWLTTDTFTWSGEFDVPCQFNTDQFNANYENYNTLTWGQIPIVEMRI